MRHARPKGATPVLALALAIALVAGGCSSTGGPGQAAGAQAYAPRAPLVAPSGPGSPWFWPFPDSWWPIQPWGDPSNPYIPNRYTNSPLLK